MVKRSYYYTTGRNAGDLKRDCLLSVRQWPGCETVKDAMLILDGEAGYRFVVTDCGAADEKLADRAARAFQNEVRRHYHYDNGEGERGQIAPAKSS